MTIPYHGLHAGAGDLNVQVLDPEDGVLGTAKPRDFERRDGHME